MNIIFLFFFLLKMDKQANISPQLKAHPKHNFPTLQIIKGEKIQGNEFSKLAPEHIREFKNVLELARSYSNRHLNL